MIERIKKNNERLLKTKVPSTIRITTYKVLNELEKSPVITIKGFRKVGKTIALIQLLQELHHKGKKQSILMVKL